MANITPVYAKLAKGVHTITWSTLTDADTALPFDGEAGAPFMPEKTVHVEDDFGSGGNIIIEGSNMAAAPTYVTMNDIHGTALATITTDALHTLAESPRLIRPRVSAGTSVSVNGKLVESNSNWGKLVTQDYLEMIEKK